jgi:hypothetical protein
MPITKTSISKAINVSRECQIDEESRLWKVDANESTYHMFLAVPNLIKNVCYDVLAGIKMEKELRPQLTKSRLSIYVKR